MEYEKGPKIRIRLKGFDYSRSHVYFVTICTWQKECLLSDVANDSVALTDVGMTVEKFLVELPERFPIRLDAFVLMPNHVHVIFSPAAGASWQQFVASWKSISAHRLNRLRQRHGRLWQEESWDRLIRHERHMAACCHYIGENPGKAGLKSGEYTLFERKPAGG